MEAIAPRIWASGFGETASVKALIDAGMPAEALAVFLDLSAVDYEAAGGRIRAALRSKNKVDEIKLANELGNRFRAQYMKTVELAEKSKATQ